MSAFPAGVVCDAARDVWDLERVRGQIPQGAWKIRADGPILGPAHTMRVSRTLRPTGTSLDDYIDAIDDVPAGSVIVVEGVGELGGAIVGDAVATRLVAQGVAGLIVDGDVRDYDGICGTGISSWVRGTRVDGVLMKKMHVEFDIPIRCGSVDVSPGDLVAADNDGILVVPAAEVAEVTAAAKALDDAEREMFALLAKGQTLREVYHSTGRA